MKAKKKKESSELRIKASEFDEMMRMALGGVPDRKAKSSNKKQSHKEEHPKQRAKATK